MENKEMKTVQILLKRVFKLIAESHFGDHKLIPWYCSSVKFPRSLGEDIATHVQRTDNDYYCKLLNNWKKEVAEVIKERRRKDKTIN